MIILNIRLFNKNYWIRRFGEPRIIKGYVTSGHEDFVASLNIHPLGTDAMQALPEGQRKVKRLEGHGEIDLRVADEETGRKADMLYYHSDWYECVSCQLWDHTILSHYNYQFVLVPTDSAKTIDTSAPNGEPVVKQEVTSDAIVTS